MTPEYAISILLADRAAALKPREHEEFCVARDRLARELHRLADRATVLLGGKLMCMASMVSLSMTPGEIRRFKPKLDDALMQARREGLLPEGAAVSEEAGKF